MTARARYASILFGAAIIASCRIPASIEYAGATAATIAAGQWWRLLTSQFVHVYFAHALLNAAAVIVVGSQLESALGSARVVVTCLVAGIAGQLTAIAIAPTIVATGASQAAIGLCAAALVLYRRQRASLPAVAYLVIQAVLDLAFAGRIKLPHIVSFVVGALLGSCWVYGARRSKRDHGELAQRD